MPHNQIFKTGHYVLTSVITVALLFISLFPANVYAQDNLPNNLQSKTTSDTNSKPEKTVDQLVDDIVSAPIPLDELNSDEKTLIPHPVAIVQTLDKITGRTATRHVTIGETTRFGPLFGIIRTCRKAPPIEEPESVAFLQIWEPIMKDEDVTIETAKSRWVFSGWMYASSPSLSAMDHPVYDIWILDCSEKPAAETDAGTDTQEKTGSNPSENQKSNAKEDS